MEVSRIEAAPTKIIDWRRLTAKEIIKYNNDGVEVPPQYLKWAIDFRQDLDKNDKDETTYEMAQNQKIQESRKKERTQAQDNEGNRQETVNGEVQGNPAADIQTENKKTDPEDMSAKQRREQMQNDGVSTVKVAKTFRAESKELTGQSNRAQGEVENIQSSSENEISMLEGQMQDTLARADDIKSKINSEKNKKSLTGNISTILQLKEQLKSLGTDAQNMLALADGDLNIYQAAIDDKLTISNDTKDYGTETILIGEDLIKENPLFGYPIGKYTIRTGQRAIDSGDELSNKANNASEVNRSNISEIESMKNQVQNKTGVGENEIKQDKQDNKNNETNKDNKNDPANTTAATETDKAASASLEQILMAKIRKGQDLEA